MHFHFLFLANVILTRESRRGTKISRKLREVSKEGTRTDRSGHRLDGRHCSAENHSFIAIKEDVSKKLPFGHVSLDKEIKFY